MFSHSTKVNKCPRPHFISNQNNVTHQKLSYSQVGVVAGVEM